MAKPQADGDVDAPDADALDQQVGDGEMQHHHQARRSTANPTHQPRGVGRRLNDGADLVGDRAEGVPGPMIGTDRIGGFSASGLRDTFVRHRINLGSSCGMSGLGFFRAARYVVRGRVFKFVKQSVVERLDLRSLRTAGLLRSFDVAEDDGPRRASCLTGRYDFAVADRAGLRVLGRDLAGADALHAIGAFLHDAPAAHRHLRVSHQAKTLGGEIGVLEEIETAHFVGTVVRAIARADAAVVNHVVEAIVAVDRRRHRADQFARGVFAVHARHGLESTSRDWRRCPR